jgi:hypothetical protein
MMNDQDYTDMRRYGYQDPDRDPYREQCWTWIEIRLESNEDP